MSANFPTSLDSYVALVDNTDAIAASHPNDRGDAIEAIEAKVGIDSSAVVTSHDYLLTHLPAQGQNWDIGSYTITALRFISDIATGTAPLTITSTTPVDNLGIYLDHATIASEAQGDILYRDASAWARLGAGTSGHFLKTQGAAANPVWAAVGGYSRVTYTGNGTGGKTVAHGLSTTPEFVWIACYSYSYIDCFWMSGFTAGYSKDGNSTMRDDGVTAVDGTNVTLGIFNGVNASGQNYVMIVM